MSVAVDQHDTAPINRHSRSRAHLLRALAAPLVILFTFFSAQSAHAEENSSVASAPADLPELVLPAATVDDAVVEPAEADEPCLDEFESIVATCPEHDVWLVSSRRASSCGDPLVGFEMLEYWRHDGDCNWIPATAEEFHATDNPRVPTIFFVHGNRVGRGEARQTGLQWVRRFEGAEYGDGPARLVIFTWPSDQIQGKPIEDVRVKAQRSQIHAWYLAALIDSLPSDVPVGLIGYSYGARLITASLHLLGGGSVAGRQLERETAAASRPMRAVLLAAALDYHWLGEGQRHGLALSQVDSMVVFVNCEDALLKLYPRLYGRGGPEALGRTGVASRSRLGEHGSKLRQINVAGAIGRNHDWHSYVNSGTVMNRARREFAFGELKTSAPPVEQDPPPTLPMAATAVSPAASATN